MYMRKGTDNMPDFSRLVNTDITDTPFQMVVFGSHSPILEVELNEMQLLEIERFRTFAKAFIGNVMDSSTTVTETSSDEYSISGVMIIDGYVVKVDNVTFTHPHVTCPLIFTISEEILDSESNVTDYSGNAINNTIIDDRCGIETTKRKSLKLSMRTEEDNALPNEITIGGFFSNGKFHLNKTTIKLKDVVSSINDINDKVEDLKKSVSDGKRAIASAITDIGVSTEADATFNTMADNIKSINPSIIINANGNISVVCGDITTDTGVFTGNAIPPDVRKNKSFTSLYGINVTGAMNEFKDYRYHPNAQINMRTKNEYTDDNGNRISIAPKKFISVYEGSVGYVSNSSHELMMLASRFGDAESDDVEYGRTFTSEYGFSITGSKQKNPLIPLLNANGAKYCTFTLSSYGSRTITCSYINGRTMIVVCNAVVNVISCGKSVNNSSFIIGTSTNGVTVQNISNNNNEYSVMAFGIEYS